MKTIYIYLKVAMGFRGAAIGVDGAGLLFKKRSTKLKESIEKALREKGIHSFKVEVADAGDLPEELLEKDGVLVLVSPYLKSVLKRLDFSKTEYYLLSEKEYDSENVDQLLKYIENKIF